MLCCNSQLQVLLGAVGNNLTQKLCKFSCMLSLFVSCFLPVQTDLRISLSMSYTSHCQIHTNLRTFAVEVCSQILKDVLANALCNTYNMLCCPGHSLFLLFKLACRNSALWTFLRCLLSFINVTAYCTYPFCHDFVLLFLIYIILLFSFLTVIITVTVIIPSYLSLVNSYFLILCFFTILADSIEFHPAFVDLSAIP